MASKIYIRNQNNGEETLLREQEVIIGRGSLLKCEDKRISRNHGIIRTNDSDKVSIVSTHRNPIFYKTNSDGHFKLIDKDSEVFLYDNDEFALLPDDFRFTIKIQSSENIPSIDENNISENKQQSTNDTVSSSESQDSTLRIRNVNEVNLLSDLSQIDTNSQNESARKLPVWLLNCNDQFSLDDSTKKRCLNTSKMDNYSSPKKKRESTEINSIISNDDKKSRTENNYDDSQKTLDLLDNQQISNTDHTPNSPQPSSSGYSGNDKNVNAISIKTEPTGPTPTTNPVSSIEADSVSQTPIVIIKKENVKKEEADSSNTRPCCKFGIKCYRQNATHRFEEAHPGDSDYRFPDYPPAPDGCPACPYGFACYRRNPIHFQQFSHPPSTDPVQNRKMKAKQDKANGTYSFRRRSPKVYNRFGYDSDFIDDDSDQDPYSDDSDDEYEPTKESQNQADD